MKVFFPAGLTSDPPVFPCVPAVLSSGSNTRIMILPGESVEFPDGPFRASIFYPGLGESVEFLEPGGGLDEVAIPSLREFIANIPPINVRHRTPEHSALKASFGPTTGGLKAMDGRARLEVEGGEAIKLSWSNGAGSAIGLNLSTRNTPRRHLAVPPIGVGEEVYVEFHGLISGSRHLGISPSDPFGRLLLGYLLTGRNALAATSARRMEVERARLRTLDWAAPSYTQLLIGYAFALGGDQRRLLAWCNRTLVSFSPTPDVNVLRAWYAFRAGRLDVSMSWLKTLDNLPLPALHFGGEMALTLADEHIERIDELGIGNDGLKLAKRPEGIDDKRFLNALINRYVAVQSRTDSLVGGVSLPATRTDVQDVSRATVPRRFITWASFAYDVIGHARMVGTHSRGKKPLFEMGFTKMFAQTMNARRPGVGSLLAMAYALLVWLAASGLWFYYDSRMAAWVFVPIQSLALVAAGTSFGIWLQQGRLSETAERLRAAELRADSNALDAIKGRALAAAIQADSASGNDGEASVYRRHSRLAHHLFGNVAATTVEGGSTPKNSA